MIWEMTRETEGLLTVVGERESWEENIDNEPLLNALRYVTILEEKRLQLPGQWCPLRLVSSRS